MSSLAVAPAATTSQVPFWLQILTIAVAPVIGFIGVAIGVAVTERNRRSAYLIDEKKKVYLEFMEMLAKITTFYSNEFTVALRKEPGWQKLQGRSKSMVESLYRTNLQIRLLGSQNVVDAAGRSVQYTLLASMTGLQMFAAEFDMREWSKVNNYGMEAMKEFSDAARKDLGLPELETKGSSISETDKERLFQYVEKFAYSTDQDSNRTTSEPGNPGRPPT